MSSKVRDYEKLAGDIIAAVGGRDNISDATHCATRLRLVLKETPSDAKDKVAAMAGVITVVESGGQFQVVIGTHVTDVYNVAAKMLHLEAGAGGTQAKKSVAAAIIGAISGCVSPIVYVLAACGLLQGALIIATAIAPEVVENTTFQVLTYMSWTPFTYLPILIALAGSKYFKVDTLLAVLCCCALVNPSWGEIAGRIAAGESLTFMMLPLAETTYTSTVLPPIIVLALLVYVERFFKSHLPEVLQPIFVPLCSYLIMVPATLLVVGPITSGVAHGLSTAFQAFYTHLPWLCAMVFGAFWQVFVIFGVHWTFVPIFLTEFEQVGFSTLQAFCGIAVCAQVGAVFGVWFKSKSKKTKSVAMSAGLTGLFGITEPTIYGITLPLKKPFICACVASAAGSLVSSFFGTLYYAFAGLAGLLTVPNAYNAANPSSLTGAAAGTAIALIGAFALVQLVGFEDKVEAAADEPAADGEEPQPAIPFEFSSPLKGEVKPLSACPDPAFASGAMGKGVVIEPAEGKLYAPCDGQVMMLFETLHAIGLKSDTGAEILIHIGLDTVKLGGEGFKAHVKNGDSIRTGDLLIEFDIPFIKGKGMSVSTPMVITNADNYADLVPSVGEHAVGDKLMDVVPA